ncbi:hypothetical protein O0Q50_21135 [Priestia aryabhattai]|uniref:Zinc finger CHC2-type domain-containing protein n=1 Tax=Priestia aryabhattai TaxID=412384 RepID=A0AAX6NDW1_PRIAR|nr:hypothetical protein [Priestia aryabhattai]MDU9693684.1 hypothetical protein [Priestia aryabhattai]
MTGKDFLKRFEASGIPLSAVYKVCVNAPEFDKEIFKKNAPGAFDYKGNLSTVFKDHQNTFATYCPFPEHQKKQTKGDAFVLHNKSHSFYCYGGCGSDRNIHLNVVQFVMCLILGVSPEVAVEFELSKIFFWPAVRFLVKNFEKELGMSLADVSKKAVYKEDVKQKILQATVDYYHFLATEIGKYSDKIDRYYLEERFFKYVYTKEEFQEHKINSKIGITPSSPDNDMLYKKLKKLKFSDKDILNARVCIKLDDGRIIDAYRNHAILPYTYGDRIIGLYGKNFNKNAKIKHKRLDGYYETPTSLQNIVNQEEFYFVEGDNTKEALKAILKKLGLYESLKQKPILNTMGSKGFKDEHAVILENYRKADPKKLKTGYSIFDPDDAGRKGTLSVGRKLQNISKIKIMVIRMPVLEKNGKPWYLDVNDLFEAYQENAGVIFEKLKKNAISLDAFTLLYFLEEEGIEDYADARIALSRHAQYLDYVPKEERLFIIEELLNLLVPVFEGEINRTELRKDLKELLMDRPVLKRTESTIPEDEEEALKELDLGLDEDEETIEEDDLEDVGPIGPAIPAIEGFEVFETVPSSPLWMITQDEEFYKQHKEKMVGLLFVNKLERMEEEIPNGTKMVLYDDSFNKDDFNSISKFETFKFHFEEDEKGVLQTIYERKK